MVADRDNHPDCPSSKSGLAFSQSWGKDMPTRLTRGLILMDAAVLVAALALLAMFAGRDDGFEAAVSAFAVQQGEVYASSPSFNLVLTFVIASGAVLLGWIGLWLDKRWGLICYAVGMLFALLFHFFDPSTVSIVRPGEAALTDLKTLVSGLLLGVGTLRFALGDLNAKPLFSRAGAK
jgi:hypothetical protein